MPFHQYEKLVVWQKSMKLVESIYALTNMLPKQEQFSLVSQMRRCVVSIPSNIAEGSRRGSDKDFSRFLLIAFGSGAELETQLKITRCLHFASEEKIEESELLLEEVMKMLNTLQKKIRK